MVSAAGLLGLAPCLDVIRKASVYSALHFWFLRGGGMHPSIRILKLSGTGNSGPPELTQALEKGELMLERLLLPETHAIAILVKDHDRVKDLFDRFEKEESGTGKEKIIGETLTE